LAAVIRPIAGCGVKRSRIRLQLAHGWRTARVDASVDEVAKGEQSYRQADHGTPPSFLSLNIDSKVAAQVLVWSFAGKVRQAGIHVAFGRRVIEIILNLVFFHNLTSYSSQ
jgi:hypothetical protein